MAKWTDDAWWTSDGPRTLPDVQNLASSSPPPATRTWRASKTPIKELDEPNESGLFDFMNVDQRQGLLLDPEFADAIALGHIPDQEDLRHLPARLAIAGFIYEDEGTVHASWDEAISDVECQSCGSWLEGIAWVISPVLEQAHEKKCEHYIANFEIGRSFLKNFYHTLNGPSDIRVLTVLPGLRGQPVECLLDTTLLETAGEYTSLSYMWGDPRERRTLFLNNNLWLVSRGVGDSLDRIRHVSESRRVWIDSLCINQLDMEERSRQVALMRDIYEQSVDCVVWLGEFPSGQSSTNGPQVHWQGDERDEELIDTCLSILGRQLNDEENLAGALCLLWWASRDTHLFDMPLFRDPVLLQSWTLHYLKALCWMLSRPYWSRVWIVQEVAVSRQVTVYIGRFTMPFSLVEKAVANLGVHLNGCCQDWMSSTLPPAFSDVIPDLVNAAFSILPLRQIRKKWHDPSFQHSLTLPRLVMSTCSRKATDPRDKVYSLIGLVKDWNSQPPFQPNYTKTTSQVFSEFAAWLLSQDLSYLIFAPTSQRLMRELPSWQPDLSATSSDDHACLQMIRPALHLFNASQHHKSNFTVARGRQKQCLILDGIKIGTIEATSKPFELWPFPDLSEVIPSSANNYHPTGQPWEQAYWRTMYLDVTGDGTSGSSLRRLSETDIARIMQDWTRYQRSDDTGAGLPTWSLDPLVISEIHHKTVFRTESGYLGLVLGDVDVSDEVFLPLGSSIPFIIRRGRRDEVEGHEEVECHRLVGWCYVHGIMDGELVGGLDNEEVGRWFLE
ncbi:hypothetical protein OQA88_2450 [Cercophora sp. LCS_1]